jgi:hypothetical protein
LYAVRIDVYHSFILSLPIRHHPFLFRADASPPGGSCKLKSTRRYLDSTHDKPLST